jgi:hypothetical protein
MSTITALGVRLDLIGPRPVAPPHSLLNTPGVVVSEDSGRWLNGVVLDTYPTDPPAVWDPCSAGTTRVKEDGAGRELPTFDAFVVYVPTTCSMFSSNGLREMTRVALEANASWGVEHALAFGVTGLSNPALGDANLTQLGADGISVAEGLARLENAIGATGIRGMIHATPGAIARMNTDALIDTETLVTTNGTPVVSGGGYIGVHPHAKTAPSDGKDWLFATGPVEVRLGPPTLSDLRTSLDRSDNTVTFRAERPALATWDTALQVGVLVDWAP